MAGNSSGQIVWLLERSRRNAESAIRADARQIRTGPRLCNGGRCGHLRESQVLPSHPPTLSVGLASRRSRQSHVGLHLVGRRIIHVAARRARPRRRCLAYRGHPARRNSNEYALFDEIRLLYLSELKGIWISDRLFGCQTGQEELDHRLVTQVFNSVQDRVHLPLACRSNQREIQ